MKDVVLPGEELASTVEFLAGEGVFEEGGKLYAQFLGTKEIDYQKRVISVHPINPPGNLRIGDIVVCQVRDLFQYMAVAEVGKVIGSNRSIASPKMASIHISKISQDYLSDIKDAFSVNDVVKAEVIQVEPSLQLSTARKDLGVVKARCTQCNRFLSYRPPNLVCDSCGITERRKVSSDYGNLRV